jgi:tRNA(Ile)-lysidine synthase
VRRAAILAYCAHWELAPIHDPSNDDTALRRNAIRHRILPLLEEFFPGAGGTLARNAALLAADEDFLQAATDRARYQREQQTPGLVTFNRAAFGREHPALQRRILRGVWSALRDLASPIGLDADTVEVARTAILSGKTGTRYALPGGLLLLLDYGTAAIGPATTLAGQLRQRLALPLVEPGWSQPLPDSGILALDERWSIEVLPMDSRLASGRMLHIPADGAAQLVLRTWRPGDRVTLANGQSRKVQDWFTDRHIPSYARHHLPLLAQGNRVLWIIRLAAFPPATPPRPDIPAPWLADSPPPFVGRMREPAEAALVEIGHAPALRFRLLYNGSPIEPIRQQ